MSNRARDREWPTLGSLRVWVCLVAAVLFAVVLFLSGKHALGMRGAAFPTLLLDPFGDFSAVRFPTWPETAPLRFPDRLLSIDGQPVFHPPARPNEVVLPAIRRQVQAASEAGRGSIALTFEHQGAPLAVTRPIRRLGADEIAFFWCFYALVAAATFTSGLVIYVGAARRAAAGAYGLWAAGAALFLATFFDYHSTGRLIPLFDVGAAATDAGFLWLAWAFPAPPRRFTRTSRAFLVALTLALATAGALLSAAPWLPFDVKTVRVALSAATPPCLLVLVVCLVVRVLSASKETRVPLRSTAFGLVTVPTLLCAGFVFNMLLGETSLQLLLPLLTPVIPLAIAYSIARHDMLGTEAVLTRKLASLPIVFLALSLGMLAWLAVRYALREHPVSWLDPVVIGLLVMLGVAALGQRVIAKTFFSATDAHRPTIDELSERISTLNEEKSILAELSRLLASWLPADRVRVLPASELQAATLTMTERAQLSLGQKVRQGDALWVPMRFSGRLTGTFRIGGKDGGALFTSADMALLETMAALGGVALHHAAALRELDLLRKSQITAEREERAGVLDTLSAEIAHELGHPLRYFRALFQGRAPSTPLDADEVAYAQDEIDRMDRMRRTLETLETPPPKKEPTGLRKPAEHARFLLRDEIAERAIEVRIEVDDGLQVLAEHAPLVQVFVNLMRNAVQAAGSRGDAGSTPALGVRALRTESGELIVEVWDSGPGISEEVRPTLFRVWGITTRKGGKGLGLMVCSRIVQQLHWTIDFAREKGLTLFRIVIPSSDLVDG